MISLSVGHQNIALKTDEAIYLAESLIAAALGVKNDLPAFTSETLGLLSVTVKDESSDSSRHFRSNPQQSDHVLTDC